MSANHFQVVNMALKEIGMFKRMIDLEMIQEQRKLTVDLLKVDIACQMEILELAFKSPDMFHRDITD